MSLNFKLNLFCYHILISESYFFLFQCTFMIKGTTICLEYCNDLLILFTNITFKQNSGM